MVGYRSVSINDHLADFIGEFIRVITYNSHYRGECVRIDPNNNNVLLKGVVKKNDAGWMDISESMLIMGHSIESVFIEKSFPFDSNESLVLSIEDGSLLPGSEPDTQGIDIMGDMEFPEEFK